MTDLEVKRPCNLMGCTWLWRPGAHHHHIFHGEPSLSPCDCDEWCTRKDQIMMFTCKVCDEKRHMDCTGVAVYMDQDGPQNYICQCYCRERKLTERDLQQRVAKVNLLIRDLGLEDTHILVEQQAVKRRTRLE